jgi:hypothetical protein
MKCFKAAVRMARSGVLGTAALAMLMAPASAAAAGSEASLLVTAVVLKRASLRVLAQPSSVVVTAADIARGYVDVPVPVQVAVRSNSPAGYVLEFASSGDFMRQILVKGLDTDVQLSPIGGAVVRPGITKTTLTLGFRFLLSDSAQQGTYAWPMRLSITPA